MTTIRICSVEDCKSKHLAKGYCRKHYLRNYKNGDMKLRVMRGSNVFDRVMAKTMKFAECIIFVGVRNSNGYGMIRYKGRMMGAHRAIYIFIHGEIPEGLEIDHRCGTRLCVNPDHLEAVSHAENVRRGLSGHDHAKRQRSPGGQFMKGFKK